MAREVEGPNRTSKRSPGGANPAAIAPADRPPGHAVRWRDRLPRDERMTDTYRFAFPTTIHFGAGTRQQVGPHLAAQGVKRPLVVTDRILSGLPVFKGFMAELTGLDAGVFAGVAGNPTRGQVMDGAAAYKAHKADA